MIERPEISRQWVHDDRQFKFMRSKQWPQYAYKESRWPSFLDCIIVIGAVLIIVAIVMGFLS